jgi:hypothetical protein
MWWEFFGIGLHLQLQDSSVLYYVPLLRQRGENDKPIIYFFPTIAFGLV